MKKLKFMAMLLAAFTLSLSFSACGDDDDKDEPEQGGEEVVTKPDVNVLQVLDQKATVTSVMVMPMGEHCEFMFQFDNENVDREKYSSFMLDIINIDCEEGQVPTGTFNFLPDYSETQTGYLSFNCELNTVWGENGAVSGYACRLINGTSGLKIARNGNIYTLTIEKMVVEYEDNATGKTGTTTTSFTYKGELRQHGQW